MASAGPSARLVRGVAVAAGLVALMAAAWPASAAGAKPIERETRSKELRPGKDGAARASCPRGARRHLLSGGFASDSPWRADLNSTLAAYASAPAKGSSWRLRAANFAGEPETARVQVLCDKRDPKVRIRRAAARVFPGGRASATARCRPSEEAVAGGFAARGFRLDRGPEVVAYASRRRGQRRWRVDAFNNSAGAAGRLLAYARCAKRRPRLRTVRVKGLAVDQAPVELKPACKRGERLWSGGFEGSYGGFDPFAAVLADSSYAAGRRWVSRFVGFQAAGEVTALAYCARR